MVCRVSLWPRRRTGASVLPPTSFPMSWLREYLTPSVVVTVYLCTPQVCMKEAGKGKKNRTVKKNAHAEHAPSLCPSSSLLPPPSLPPSLLPFLSLPGSSVGPPSSTSTTPVHEGSKQTRKKKLLPLSRRRQSRNLESPMSVESLDISQPPAGTGGTLDSSNSIPSTPDPTSADMGMEIGPDGTGCPEPDDITRASTTRSSGAKVRLSSSHSFPLTVIEEPALEEREGADTGSPPERLTMSLQRSPSPSLQISPSPVRDSSPNASPRSLRKTRIAHTRRRGSHGERAITL